MPAILNSEVASRRQAEKAIMKLLRENRGRGIAIGEVLRQTRNVACVDEATARRAVLQLAADHEAVVDSMLNISLAE